MAQDFMANRLTEEEKAELETYASKGMKRRLTDMEKVRFHKLLDKEFANMIIFDNHSDEDDYDSND